MSLKSKVQSSRLFWTSSLILLAIHCSMPNISAQNKACPFDRKTMQFVGSSVEQARCLLRKVEIQGAVGDPLAKLPEPLEKLVGRKIDFEKTKFAEFLAKRKIDEKTLGGLLGAPLSKAVLPDGTEIPALYFVIHDTSSPYLKDQPFPANIDQAEYAGNKLEQWLKLPVAHVFVNRAGESITTVDFDEKVKQGWGTKFARDFLKADGKGLQLHVELVQPRRLDPNRQPQNTNDAIAPIPGFTRAQYERLALVYIAASLRAGKWLIPAFHAAVDAGIKDAHDDPQNFELENWAKIINEIIEKASGAR